MVTFETKKLDLGILPEDFIVDFEFPYEGSGIKKISPSCGCTSVQDTGHSLIGKFKTPYIGNIRIQSGFGEMVTNKNISVFFKDGTSTNINIVAEIVRTFDAEYFDYNEPNIASRDAPLTGLLMHPKLMRMLDAARELAGVPFYINSGYRTIAHNKRVGGVNGSAHTKGLAVDIRISPDTKDIILSSLESAGFERIGISPYFIHVDIDHTKPSPARWTY